MDYAKVSHVGLDNHKNFSSLTARDPENAVIFRRRLEHEDRPRRQMQKDARPATRPE